MDLTLVEVNVDGTLFGSATVGTGPEGDEAETPGTAESDPAGRSVARRVLPLDPAAVAFAAAVGYVASRRFGRDRGTTIDGEPVEIEG